MRELTNWRQLISDEMARHQESLEDTISMVPIGLDLDRKFDGGLGSAEGEPFTLWTAKRVYFPTEYDGEEDVASVPRDPCDEVTKHI